MAARPVSPAVGRRRIGSELRRLREHANLTIEHVAVRLECSSSKISRIETGHIGASPRDVRDMLALYGVEGEDAEGLIQTARDARQKGWWQAYGKALTGAYVGLEASAARIKGYEALQMPGLLQTSEYATAVIRAARPEISDALLERRLEVRAMRQAPLLAEQPLELWTIIDEAVLHRVVGGTEIMSAQLARLIEAAGRPNVTVQVLPFSAGAHAGMDGTFAILEYDEAADPDFVFAENATGGLFLEKEPDVEHYRNIFGYLSRSALPAQRSLEIIANRMEELR